MRPALAKWVRSKKTLIDAPIGFNKARCLDNSENSFKKFCKTRGDKEDLTNGGFCPGPS